MQFEADSQARLEQLVSRDARAEQLDDDRRRALESLRMEAANVRVTREAGAPLLAEAIQKGLRGLAMQRARVEIRVGPGELGDGSDVAFLLTANPGAEPLPLTKVASGGELARAMLATRLAMLPASTRRSGRSEVAMEETCDSARWPGRDPETLVFDEVDAGIGGAAATAVGRALAQLGQRRQVLVVTHLAQVAAFASSHVLVAKSVRRGKSVTTARTLGADERVTELGRMLSGQPESATARRHAEELLDLAKRRSR